MIGAAIGVAIVGSVYQLSAYRQLDADMASENAELREVMQRIIGGDKGEMLVLENMEPAQFEVLKMETLEIINASFDSAIFFLVILCAVCTVMAGVLIPRRHHFFAAPSMYGKEHEKGEGKEEEG